MVTSYLKACITFQAIFSSVNCVSLQLTWTVCNLDFSVSPFFSLSSSLIVCLIVFFCSVWLCYVQINKCLFQQLLHKMAEQMGHASSETITVTLLNIRNLVSFIELLPVFSHSHNRFPCF